MEQLGLFTNTPTKPFENAQLKDALKHTTELAKTAIQTLRTGAQDCATDILRAGAALAVLDNMTKMRLWAATHPSLTARMNATIYYKWGRENFREVTSKGPLEQKLKAAAADLRMRASLTSHTDSATIAQMMTFAAFDAPILVTPFIQDIFKDWEWTSKRRDITFTEAVNKSADPRWKDTEKWNSLHPKELQAKTVWEAKPEEVLKSVAKCHLREDIREINAMGILASITAVINHAPLSHYNTEKMCQPKAFGPMKAILRKACIPGLTPILGANDPSYKETEVIAAIEAAKGAGLHRLATQIEDAHKRSKDSASGGLLEVFGAVRDEANKCQDCKTNGISAHINLGSDITRTIKTHIFQFHKDNEKQNNPRKRRHDSRSSSGSETTPTTNTPNRPIRPAHSGPSNTKGNREAHWSKGYPMSTSQNQSPPKRGNGPFTPGNQNPRGNRYQAIHSTQFHHPGYKTAGNHTGIGSQPQPWGDGNNSPMQNRGPWNINNGQNMPRQNMSQ